MITIGRSSDASLDAAWARLCEWFLPFKTISVLVSGGVDSSLLLKAAATQRSGRTVTAVTADSPSIARSEMQQVRDFVKGMGIAHLLLKTDELSDPSYQANLGNRCYFCKKALYQSLDSTLYSALAQRGAREKDDVVVDGTNTDDLQDHRPSLPASREHGLRHPYLELGFGKQVIRDLSRKQDLPMWNKPAMACLASRIQDGITVSDEKLALIERAEAFLSSLGMQSVRVRYHESGSDTFMQKIARIEVPPADLSLFGSELLRSDIAHQLKALGFTHVTVDLEGYKKGGRAL